MQKESTTALRKRRKTLLRQLPPLQAILRGSLIERYKRCGKPGCKCADGPGHGPKYYLSDSSQLENVEFLRDALWEAINGIEEKAVGIPIAHELEILDSLGETLGAFLNNTNTTGPRGRSKISAE